MAMTFQADTVPRPLDARLRATLAAVVLCGATLALGAFAMRGPATALSVGIGASVAAANLWALARIVSALLPNGSRLATHVPGSAMAWSVLAAFKMFALFATVWLLLRYALVSPLPMLVGFGALPAGIAIGSLVSDRSASGEP
jgi:hypothetical protein